MTEYERRTGHRTAVHRQCDRLYCQICEGLFICTVCGGAEGSLLPKCPGHMLTMEEHDANYMHYCAGTGPFTKLGRWS